MSADKLQKLWECGYSIAELWGASAPVKRLASEGAKDHAMMWGILGIVEYQVDKGAGHKYLRDRLSSGDWVGIGADESSGDGTLRLLPPLQDAKFGRKKSAVGNAEVTYVNVRFVHKWLFERADVILETADVSP
ncbi:MAG: hypothetical protein JO254_12060 [Pseudolabrys sp.]|nr:hypothetical protein [Pseudolabrys sp.]